MEHAVQLIQDGVVPEPQDAKTGLFQDVCPGGAVFCVVRMLAAVQLDDQFGFEAGEIGEVAVNRNLSAEFESRRVGDSVD